MRDLGLLVALVLTPVAGCIADFPPELVERKDSAVIQDVARLEGFVVDAPVDAPGDAPHDAPVDIMRLDKMVPPADKTVPPPDKTVFTDTSPPQCPPVCNGGCTGGVCTIIQGANTTAIPKCPAKMPCKVVCKGDKACENGVDCSQATDCDITCDAATGTDACKNAMVKCGSGHCKVSCTGKDTCNKGIDCYKSCGCHIYCKGSQACLKKICPPSPTCCSPPTACQCP
jgi:hypothetical protein